MSIRFSVVGRANQIVVSSGDVGGNIVQVVEDLLARINTDIDDRKSYTADQVTFHYIVSSKIVYMCVADQDYPVTQAYYYLQTLQNEWTRYYGARGLSVSPSAANAEFGRKMTTLMPAPASGPSSPVFGRSPSNPSPSDKVEMVSRQIEDVKKQMVQNLDSVLARGEGIEKLVQSTSDLNTNAAQFRSTAVKLKRHMCWKNAKCWIIIGVVLVILAFIIALIICKGNFKTCGGKKSSKSPSPRPSPSPSPHPAPVASVPVNPVPITPPTTAPISPPISVTPVTPVTPPTEAPTVVPVEPPVAPPTPAPVPTTPTSPIAPSTPIAAPVAAPLTPPTQPSPVPSPVAEPAAVPLPEAPIAPVSAPEDPIPLLPYLRLFQPQFPTFSR